MSVAEVRLKVKVATREKGHTKGHTKLRLFAADPSVGPFFSKAKGGAHVSPPLPKTSLYKLHPNLSRLLSTQCPHFIFPSLQTSTTLLKSL